jgi:hypothetical protein
MNVQLIIETVNPTDSSKRHRLISSRIINGTLQEAAEIAKEKIDHLIIMDGLEPIAAEIKTSPHINGKEPTDWKQAWETLT